MLKVYSKHINEEVLLCCKSVLFCNFLRNGSPSPNIQEVTTALLCTKNQLVSNAHYIKKQTTSIRISKCNCAAKAYSSTTPLIPAYFGSMEPESNHLAYLLRHVLLMTHDYGLGVSGI